MQVKDVHSATGKLPAQLNLKRMSHVVVNDHTERTVTRCASMLARVVARDVTHAAAFRCTGPQTPAAVRSLTRPESILLVRPPAFQEGAEMASPSSAGRAAVSGARGCFTSGGKGVFCPQGGGPACLGRLPRELAA